MNRRTIFGQQGPPRAWCASEPSPSREAPPRIPPASAEFRARVDEAFSPLEAGPDRPCVYRLAIDIFFYALLAAAGLAFLLRYFPG